MLKILSKFIQGSPRVKHKVRRRKTTGQSLVEIAIAFPFIIVLLSGVVEFGFVINYYLSLLDATREAARFWSNGDPFLPNTTTDDPAFYTNVIDRTVFQLQGIDPLHPIIELDSSVDDVIVTVYSVYVPVSGTPVITQYPSGGPQHRYGNQESAYDSTEIFNILTSSGDPLVCTGVLVVEVYWSYESVLNLPWLDPLFPALLHTYSMMPLVAAEPIC
jgi:hypothetical protein